MTTEITKEQATQEGPMPDLSVVADQLVAAARQQGVELTGPGGLLTSLTKQVLETALEVELTEHLGHERNERSGSGKCEWGEMPPKGLAAALPSDLVKRGMQASNRATARPGPWSAPCSTGRTNSP
jgi:hypothetical protein